MADDVQEYEAWQNATLGRVVVIKLDSRGQQRHDLIGPGKTFHITPIERRMNQERAASEEQDVFLNGVLQPVTLLENAEDFERLKENPNHVSEDDVRSMFKFKLPEFRARLEQIGNPAALERLMEVARSKDVMCTLHQFEAIQARLVAVSPSIYDQGQPDLAPSMASPNVGPPSGIKAITPR
jgi:hypothetical protein